MGALESYPRITPFLWFDSNAEEAVELYLSIFKNSRRLDTLIANEDGPVRKGKTLTIAFELDGQKFSALNGGPLFHFTEAISFVVRLRHSGGSGRVLVEAFGRRKRRPVLLAQGQIWPFLADCARRAAAVDQASQSVPGHAADAKAGPRAIAEGGK